MKQDKNWEKRFEKFWIIITDPRSTFKGRPAYNGCSYMSVGNAVMDFIRGEREEHGGKLIRKLEKMLERNEQITNALEEFLIACGSFGFPSPEGDVACLKLKKLLIKKSK